MKAGQERRGVREINTGMSADDKLATVCLAMKIITASFSLLNLIRNIAVNYPCGYLIAAPAGMEAEQSDSQREAQRADPTLSPRVFSGNSKFDRFGRLAGILSVAETKKEKISGFPHVLPWLTRSLSLPSHRC